MMPVPNQINLTKKKMSETMSQTTTMMMMTVTMIARISADAFLDKRYVRSLASSTLMITVLERACEAKFPLNLHA
jgi:hypothetical protein